MINRAYGTYEHYCSPNAPLSELANVNWRYVREVGGLPPNIYLPLPKQAFWPRYGEHPPN